MKSESQFVSPFVVRIVAGIVALIDIAIIAIVIINFSSFPTWFAVLVVSGVVVTLYLPYKAIRTGRPEWVLIDLISPF